MRKRVLSLALLCCFAPPFGLIHAAETEQAEFLVLKMADSKTAEFKLSTRPVIAFSDDKLQITSNEISTDYPQSDVTEFYFTAISTGIEEKVNPSTMSFSYTDNATIRISGSAAGEAVLYDANGKLLQRQKVSGGNATINVASYAPGVYILNLTNEHSFKSSRNNEENFTFIHMPSCLHSHACTGTTENSQEARYLSAHQKAWR